jgi:hypothetical protein
METICRFFLTKIAPCSRRTSCGLRESAFHRNGGITRLPCPLTTLFGPCFFFCLLNLKDDDVFSSHKKFEKNLLKQLIVSGYLNLDNIFLSYPLSYIHKTLPVIVVEILKKENN